MAKSKTRAFPRHTPPVEMVARRRALGRNGNYTVISRDGVTRYAVEVYADGNVLCTCEAGRRGIVCYHAAVALRRYRNEVVAS